MNSEIRSIERIMIEYLIMKATNNWKHHIRQTTNKKVLFLLGASGCGKTSLGTVMMEKCDDERAVLISEVGGELRKLSASTSEMFEAPFEFATLALEITNMSCIAMGDYGNAPLIIDGGIIQDYAHLRMRRENLDERLQGIFSELYIKLMTEWFWHLPNVHFLLLRHRDRREYNEKFEFTIYSRLTQLLTANSIKVNSYNVLEPDMITFYLQSNDNIPPHILNRIRN